MHHPQICRWIIGWGGEWWTYWTAQIWSSEMLGDMSSGPAESLWRWTRNTKLFAWSGTALTAWVAALLKRTAKDLCWMSTWIWAKSALTIANGAEQALSCVRRSTAGGHGWGCTQNSVQSGPLQFKRDVKKLKLISSKGCHDWQEFRLHTQATILLYLLALPRGAWPITFVPPLSLAIRLDPYAVRSPPNLLFNNLYQPAPSVFPVVHVVGEGSD